MNESNFPLQKILTLHDTNINPPEYLRHDPKVDMTACFNDHPDKESLSSVDILRQWPLKGITTSMDESQLEAVHRILTKELAIVQGPPGCGKTFVRYVKPYQRKIESINLLS